MERPNSLHSEEIPLSTGKNAVQFVIGALAGVFGGLLGLRFAALVITTDNQGDMPRWLTVLLGWLCLLFSLALVGVGVFTTGRAMRLIWRRDRLFLGDTHLRCVAQDGQVLVQVPYDNIADIKFVEDEDYHHGPRDDRVAIVLFDRNRGDTILREESPLEVDEHEDEGDIILRDCFQIAPRNLYEKLIQRWRGSRHGDRHRGM